MISNYLEGIINSLSIFKVVYEDTKYIKDLASRFNKFDKVLLLGTGGASLGSKCLVNYYSMINNISPKVIYFENSDYRHFCNLLKNLNPDTTGLIIISKSGRTTETLMSLLTLKKIWNNFDFKNNALAITTQNSDLFKLAANLNVDTIEHPDIGGRFSAFSIIGLLPAYIAGADIDLFLNNAKLTFKNINKISQDIELMYKYFKDEKINIHVLFLYSDFLSDFGYWFRQLISESLGQVAYSGITPVLATGTVDQHSMLQLFLAGPKNKFYTFIKDNNIKDIENINCDMSSPILKRLNGKNMNNLMDAHFKATIESIKKESPVRIINFNNLGELMMISILEVIGLAKLFNINPFEQPAVEKAKELVFKYL